MTPWLRGMSSSIRQRMTYMTAAETMARLAFRLSLQTGSVPSKSITRRSSSIDPAVCQNDVCVQDLTRGWINSTRANGGTHVVVKPSYKVVLDIFGVFFHVVAGRLVLLANFDCVHNSYLLECLVPILNSLANPTSITHGCGVFQVENDRSVLGYRPSQILTSGHPQATEMKSAL